MAPEEIKEFIRSKIEEGLTYGEIQYVVEKEYGDKITRSRTKSLIGYFKGKNKKPIGRADEPAYCLTEKGEGIIDGKEPYLRSTVQMAVLGALYEKPMNACELEKKLGHCWGKLPDAIKRSEKAGLISTDGKIRDNNVDGMIEYVLDDAGDDEKWIYEFILGNPGCTRIDMCGEFVKHFSLSALSRNLKKMEKDGVIHSNGHVKKCYHVAGGDTAAKILLAMKENPGASQKEIAEIVGVTPPTVTYHLKKAPSPEKAAAELQKEIAEKYGLTEGAYVDVMVAISENPGITDEELAEKTYVKYGKVKAILAGLAEKGHIRSKRKPHYYAINRPAEPPDDQDTP